jgi:hypothetical protein
MAKPIREENAEMIDRGHADRRLLEEILKERGPKLLPPHMLHRRGGKASDALATGRTS